MGLRNALKLFRGVEAVPPGAARPSSTMWFDPGGNLPPVAWWPSSGQFSTMWDWDGWQSWQVPAVWRARSLIANSIGGMVLGAWKGTDRVQPLPTVLVEPNPGEDRCNTVAAWVGDLLDHGNAIGVVSYNDRNDFRPQAVAPSPCVEWEIGREEGSGRLFYRHGDFVYDRSQVFHAKMGSLPGEARGMGVLEVGLSTLQRARTEADYAANAFANGMPSGLLRVKDPDLQVGEDDDEPSYVTAKGIKRAWHESVSTGDIAVLSELVDFQPLSWTPTDAQMVEARSLSLTDIANLYGLDGWWLGAPSSSMTYQNVQQAALQLSRFSLEFPITALESEFSRLLPRGTEARFNRDSVLQDDMTTRVNNTKNMIDAGLMTVDEGRALFGMGPMPESEKPKATVVQLGPVTDPEQNKAVGSGDKNLSA